MQLNLARIDVDVAALRTYAAIKGMDDGDGLYAVHHALRMRFGDHAPQPFSAVLSGPEPHVVGYLPQDHAERLSDVRPCEDRLLERIFVDKPQTRVMPKMWKEGARLSFRLRARPVVRYSKEVAALIHKATGWMPPGREVDVVTAEAGRTGSAPDPDRACRDWLERRLEGAAVLDQFVLRDYAMVRSTRSLHAGGKYASAVGPDAVMAGTLQVTDAGRFEEVLSAGVGRNAAFGYGMLLLSPAR